MSSRRSCQGPSPSRTAATPATARMYNESNTGYFISSPSISTHKYICFYFFRLVDIIRTDLALVLLVLLAVDEVAGEDAAEEEGDGVEVHVEGRDVDSHLHDPQVTTVSPSRAALTSVTGDCLRLTMVNCHQLLTRPLSHSLPRPNFQENTILC